jgi:hypothetical protein
MLGHRLVNEYIHYGKAHDEACFGDNNDNDDKVVCHLDQL